MHILFLHSVSIDASTYGHLVGRRANSVGLRQNEKGNIFQVTWENEGIICYCNAPNCWTALIQGHDLCNIDSYFFHGPG
jgi:hypothetical protein